MVKATAILHCTVEEFTVKPPVLTIVNAWCKSSYHLKCVQTDHCKPIIKGGCKGQIIHALYATYGAMKHLL
jgi:hypothetical protein